MSTEVLKETMCKCTHQAGFHLYRAGTCVMQDCPCKRFEEVDTRVLSDATGAY